MHTSLPSQCTTTSSSWRHLVIPWSDASQSRILVWISELHLSPLRKIGVPLRPGSDTSRITLAPIFQVTQNLHMVLRNADFTFTWEVHLCTCNNCIINSKEVITNSAPSIVNADLYSPFTDIWSILQTNISSLTVTHGSWKVCVRYLFRVIKHTEQESSSPWQTIYAFLRCPHGSIRLGSIDGQLRRWSSEPEQE